MRDEVLATFSNMPLLRKLHVGAALVIVAIATINAGVVGFVFTGLWMASSFTEKTRWLFYGMLLVQAWSNWHIIGLLLSIGFIAFCVSRNLAYKKLHPAEFSPAGRSSTAIGEPREALFDTFDQERADRDADYARQQEIDMNRMREDAERLASGERNLLEP